MNVLIFNTIGHGSRLKDWAPSMFIHSNSMLPKTLPIHSYMYYALRIITLIIITLYFNSWQSKRIQGLEISFFFLKTFLAMKYKIQKFVVLHSRDWNHSELSLVYHMAIVLIIKVILLQITLLHVFLDQNHLINLIYIYARSYT